MITSEERMRLMRQFQHEPVYVYGVLLRAAAGLLVIVMITLVGVTSESGEKSGSRNAELKRHERATVSDSRKLYEERRANFEAGRSQTAASGSLSHAPADESPVLLPAAAHSQKPVYTAK